jgi:prolyl-tRNA synthetase
MKYSHAFIKTNKSAAEMDAINATLLTKAGFIDQTMAGVYTFLPLGWRVLNKIENIIRREMDTMGAEILMPALSPRALWETTKRTEIDVLFEARGANESSRKRNGASYILNPTHEEVITPIAAKIKPSYKDLPFAIYQIQTKYRNEARPKSGLLRGREFRMKDLYSFHTTDEDRQRYYDEAKEAYKRIFANLGLGDDTVIALASGGDFTKDFSHEFQTKCESGEDTIFYDEKNDVYYNQEVAPAELKKAGHSFSACEVGNIFPLGTKFPDAFGYHFTDETGKQQQVWMASYGIGSTRIMGVLVEKFHDERGIMWPAAVAPFTVHLVGLNLDDEAVLARAEAVYKQLQEAGVDVLFDDRPAASPGAKLADADLIGCPWRVVISRKTGEQVELKARSSSETELVAVEELLKRL